MCEPGKHYTSRLGALVRRSDDAREIGPLVLVFGRMRWLTGFLWFALVGDEWETRDLLCMRCLG